ncbi:transposase [Streptomyces sp. BYX5S]
MSVRAMWELLHRHGWRCLQPVRRAVERDEQVVTGWVKETWPSAKPSRRRSGPGSSLRTRPRSRWRPHHSRTWAPRGDRPLVRFIGGSRGRDMLAALACYHSRHRSRLIHRPRIQGHLRGDHSGFTWHDYRNLIVRAHLQLAAPIVLIWDNLNLHRSTDLRRWAACQDWLTIIQLPSYAHNLNPVEGIWSLLRRTTTANMVFNNRDHLEQAVRRGLRRIRRSPHLIDGCLIGTGLTPLPESDSPTTPRRGQ